MYIDRDIIHRLCEPVQWHGERERGQVWQAWWMCVSVHLMSRRAGNSHFLSSAHVLIILIAFGTHHRLLFSLDLCFACFHVANDELLSNVNNMLVFWCANIICYSTHLACSQFCIAPNEGTQKWKKQFALLASMLTPNYDNVVVPVPPTWCCCQLPQQHILL